MSNPEIQSWISTSEGPGGEEEHSNAFRWDSLNEDSKWPSFLDYAKGQLLTSSTKTRVACLTKRLLPLAARGGTQHVESHQQAVILFSINRAPRTANPGNFPTFDIDLSSLYRFCF